MATVFLSLAAAIVSVSKMLFSSSILGGKIICVAGTITSSARI
jgi:hypothetical protein